MDIDFNSMDFNCGLHAAYAVGYAKAAHKAVVYRIWVPDYDYSSVEPLNAAYDGEMIRVRGVTSAMLLRGRGLSSVPMYGLFAEEADAKAYAHKLTLTVRRKTMAHLEMFDMDPHTVTKKQWNRLFRGLWSIPVRAWE